MDAAEHLPRQVDAVRAALVQPVENAAPRPVDTGQAEDPRALFQPPRIAFGPSGTTPFAGG